MFFFASALIVSFLALGRAQLPNPNCTWTESDKSLTCNLELEIPGNFNVHQIPLSVQTLDIGSTDNEMFSILYLAAEPLPELPFLTSLTMRNFLTDPDRAALFIPFLANVKANLTTLAIPDGPVGNLTAEFFQGFNKLEHLRLSSNLNVEGGMEAIDVRAFEGLGALRTVELFQTYWTTFDWAVFAPVAEHLERVILSAQISLQSITVSRNFSFGPRFDHLTIQAAYLDLPPRSFFDTLRVNSTSRISILSTRFCRPSGLLLKGTCACCAAKDLVSWANEITAGASRPSHLQFTCENQLWTANATTVSLPDGDQYGCCVNANVTNCLTSTTKATTTTTVVTSTTTLAGKTDKPNNNAAKISAVYGVVTFLVAAILSFI